MARAIALAIPAAGGNHRAFGTDAKALQVGFAVDAGVRAAALAAAGATADPAVVDAWLKLVGAAPEPAAGRPDQAASHPEVDQSDRAAAVPAVGRRSSCIPAVTRCSGLLPPFAPQSSKPGSLVPEAVSAITFSAPEGTLRPLIHDRPSSGLQAEFSLPYAAAATLLDGSPGLASFTDEAVARPQARALLDTVTARVTPGGEDLLAGAVAVELLTDAGPVAARSSRSRQAHRRDRQPRPSWHASCVTARAPEPTRWQR